MTSQLEVGGTKSMFGPQVLSNRTSAPQSKFGTSKRSEPIYMEFMDDLLLGKTGPGHEYNLSSSLGPQALAQHSTAPSHVFGTRGDLAALEQDTRPGPGQYKPAESIGQQALSTKQTSASPRFKSSNRWSNYKSDFRKDFYCNSHVVGEGNEPGKMLGEGPAYSFSGKAGRYDPSKQGVPGRVPTFLQSPAPGRYATVGAFGGQTLSQKASAPQNKIGSATRDKQTRLYLSRDHEKDLRGLYSPGPNRYGQVSSMGNQALSKKKNTSSYRFGSSDRFSDVKPIKPRPTPTDPLGATGTALKVLPGPGEYTV